MTELKYQELVEGYYDNLNNNLRNFKGGPGFLETWVHDEDHNRSLLEILDLAHTHGVGQLKIELPKDVVGQLNLDWLRKNSVEFGTVHIDGAKLSFSNTKSDYVADDFAAVNGLYLQALKQRMGAIRLEGPMESRNLQVFVGQDSGGELAVGVDDKGIIREAKHKGFSGHLRPLMDAFCGTLAQRSLHEGAEHGAIRLEAELRDPAQSVRVKGLLTPETADAMFVVPQKLVRMAFQQYLQKNSLPLKRNFWRDPVPSSWLELPYEDKMKQAQKKLSEACSHFSLQADVLVTEIKNDTRLVLSYVQDKSRPDFGRHMIRLERWLRTEMGFEVELQLESIEDRNKRVERTKRT